MRDAELNSRNIKGFLLKAQVVIIIANVVISRCCLAEDGEELF